MAKTLETVDTSVLSTAVRHCDERQSDLLVKRGAVKKAKFSFEAELPATQLAKPRSHADDRLGAKLHKAASHMGLEVDKLAAALASDTPVGVHNSQQQTQRLCKLRPGDAICDINGFQGAEDMLQELQNATTPSSTKKINLRVERRMSDTFAAPSPVNGSPSPALLAGMELLAGTPAMDLDVKDESRRRRRRMCLEGMDEDGADEVPAPMSTTSMSGRAFRARPSSKGGVLGDDPDFHFLEDGWEPATCQRCGYSWACLCPSPLVVMSPGGIAANATKDGTMVGHGRANSQGRTGRRGKAGGSTGWGANDGAGSGPGGLAEPQTPSKERSGRDRSAATGHGSGAHGADAEHEGHQRPTSRLGSRPGTSVGGGSTALRAAAFDLTGTCPSTLDRCQSSPQLQKKGKPEEDFRWPLPPPSASPPSRVKQMRRGGTRGFPLRQDPSSPPALSSSKSAPMTPPRLAASYSGPMSPPLQMAKSSPQKWF